MKKSKTCRGYYAEDYLMGYEKHFPAIPASEVERDYILKKKYYELQERFNDVAIDKMFLKEEIRDWWKQFERTKKLAKDYIHKGKIKEAIDGAVKSKLYTVVRVGSNEECYNNAIWDFAIKLKKKLGLK